MPTAPTLTDGPVTLRHPQESDVQGSWEQCQDPLSQQWTTVPIPYSHDDARDFILGFVPGAWESDKEWGFVVEAEGRYAGHICLRNEGSRRAEIAYGSHPWVRGTRATWSTRCGCCSTGASARRTWRPSSGWPTSATGRRDGWPGSSGSPSRARCGSGSPTAASFATPGPAPCWPTTLASRSGAGSTTRSCEGPGVRLRPFREDDAARVVEACRDERTRMWLGDLPSPYTEEDALAFIRGRTGLRANGDGLSWAVADPDERHDHRLGRALRPDRRPRVRRGRLLDPPRRPRARA